MNIIATTLLVSSLALGGFAVANADDDRYDDDRYERDDHDERYGYSGKSCEKYGKKFGKRMEYMIERLELNEEQEKQVRSIRDSYHPKVEALRDKMRDNRKQLRETMHADTIDQAKVKQLAQQIGDLKTDKIILRAQMRNEFHKVLTKEQLEKMKNSKGHHGYEHREYKHGHHS